MSIKSLTYLTSLVFTGIVACGSGDEPGLTYGEYLRDHPRAGWRDYATQTIRQAARQCRDSLVANRQGSPERRADAGYMIRQTTETEAVALLIALNSKSDAPNETDVLQLYRSLERTRRAQRMNVLVQQKADTIPGPQCPLDPNHDVRQNFATVIEDVEQASDGSHLFVIMRNEAVQVTRSTKKPGDGQTGPAVMSLQN